MQERSEMQQRQGYQAVEKLRETLDEKYLWEVILLYAGESFKTYTGLPFTYEVRKGRNGDYTRELWIDRRENSKSLSQRFEASLYVIPSSIHECMVIPDYDVFPEECLSDMVRDVNEKTVKPQEILSDHVYYYHRESGELTLCEEET